MDQLLIGKLLGTVDLGFYTLAYKLMILPLQNISGVISGVAFPAFSRIHHDLERTRANYVKMVRVISQLSLPLMAGLFAAAPELVQLLFGPGWEPVVFLGRVFCFCGMLGSIGSTVHTIYQSQGRPDINAMFSLFFALPMTVLAVLVGLPYGINGIAICYALRTVLVIGLSHYIANRVIGLGWSQFTIAQRRGYVSALLVGLAMLFAGELGKAVIGPGTWLSLLLKAGVGFSVFMYLLLHSGLHMREAYAERFSKR